MRKQLFILMILAFSLFADAGPSPAKPDITVTFIKGEDTFGVDASDTNLTFVCQEPNGQDSPVDKHEVAFECATNCKNTQWFYKLNPCYYPKAGYFRYIKQDGTQMQTQELSFNESRTYDVKIAIDSGAVKVESQPSLCPFSLLVLLAGLGAAAFAVKK